MQFYILLLIQLILHFETLFLGNKIMLVKSNIHLLMLT